MNNKQTRAILVIYTGGTIGMDKNPKTGQLEAVGIDKLCQYIPELEKFHHRIDYQSISRQIDSSDMTPKIWQEVASIIEEEYDHYDGFVILHGTDTMSYTASALSFMLENLNKTIVLTGSQLPMSALRNDAHDNLITALIIAAESKVPEVCIYFENKLFRGNRTTKLNAENFDAFFSGNYAPLAETGLYINYNKSKIAKPGNGKLKVHPHFDENIAILKIFPGITQNVLHHILNVEGLRGVILETYGSGNAPTAPWFSEELEAAIRKNIIVFNILQCKSGRTAPKTYQAGLRIDGIVNGNDITGEAAITKLMFLLGQHHDNETVKKLLVTPLRGEMA
ncbi:MAG: asparaginase [Bacteroidales bacterium]|nr:asparaginase [Bacteroidales bacterium]